MISRNRKQQWENPEAWAKRAIAYLEANIDKFTPDTPEQAAWDRETYELAFMMDASRRTYTEHTISMLKQITNASDHGRVLTIEIRVDWAAEYLSKLEARS